MKKIILAIAAAGLALPSFADEVRLKNGALLQGVVREKDDSIIVEMDIGTITLKKSEVGKITPSRGPLYELEERERGAHDAAGYYNLAVWSEQQGLSSRARDFYRKTLELDPNHKEARRALGYTFREGRWMTNDELMRAKGLVRYNDRWMTPEERDKAVASEREETLRLQALEAAAEMQRKAEAARALVERARLETLRQNALWTSWVPVPWSPLPWSPYRVAGFAESQQLPSSGVPQSLPLSGVPQSLPLSGVPQQLPLSGTPYQAPMEAR